MRLPKTTVEKGVRTRIEEPILGAGAVRPARGRRAKGRNLSRGPLKDKEEKAVAVAVDGRQADEFPSISTVSGERSLKLVGILRI